MVGGVWWVECGGWSVVSGVWRMECGWWSVVSDSGMIVGWMGGKSLVDG